ncbi:amidase [Vibrio quintilis]|uniref:Glutamyl-tRNA(Gln) amidotransferase subunit A n=1 Tax=Vibrio quintilis TaxID=1117707 RepID=A0A1M7Z277_9VIBR|nr:amidase [Vibrio quintilis]SHO58756.1 Glutamyl-tRNA(Gln) amidotransferase subunit A [Vibrio quintilis]
MQKTFQLEEATIEELQEALSNGVITSVELTTLYLNRIDYYDHHGLRLNSIPLINADALKQAQAMDELRRQGTLLGPIHGIPFTVKDSYMVKGMTVANGSPALAGLTAREDSFVVAALRAAGGILIGKTNMPPMAAGGMQRGLYGRAESPYNGDYLPAAWFSGSSNGSGTSTAANFAVFGMAEETVSSGRSPASNNGLVAYTPSWGVLSVRGNWPLFPVRDVVVPHTRTVADLTAVLDVIMRDDPITTCDFWRDQKVVTLPESSACRPKDFSALTQRGALRGKRIGVPKMYTGKAEHDPVPIRPSIQALWQRAAADLRALGAEVVETGFPLMEQYHQDPIHLQPFVEQGLLPPGWMEQEWNHLAPNAIEAFLRYVGDENYPGWADIDPDTVFPNPVGSVDERRGHENARYRENIAVIRQGYQPPESLPGFSEALVALNHIREVQFEQWLKTQNLDLLAFPANCDIGQANADTNETAYDHAWQNGNFFSNTNHMMRHLGIPSVSVCMGMMEDTKMPVNLTLMGPGYSDNELIRCAYDYEQSTQHRIAAPRTPPLPAERFEYDPASCIVPARRPAKAVQLSISDSLFEGRRFRLTGQCDPACVLRLFINGHEINGHPINSHEVRLLRQGHQWEVTTLLAPLFKASHGIPETLHIIVLAKTSQGAAVAVEKTVSVPGLYSGKASSIRS